MLPYIYEDVGEMLKTKKRMLKILIISNRLQFISVAVVTAAESYRMWIRQSHKTYRIIELSPKKKSEGNLKLSVCLNQG